VFYTNSEGSSNEKIFIAKAMVKGGIILYEKGKGVIAEVGERFEDILAEAKAELAEERTERMD
jgi:hypothetical protein